MDWRVLETRDVAKNLLRLPKRVQIIYRQLVIDLTEEGPKPFGWDVIKLNKESHFRIRLNREYRVIVEVLEPDILVIKVAHRKDVYR